MIRKEDLTKKRSGINAVLSDEVIDTIDPPSMNSDVPSFLKNEGIRKTLEDLAKTRPDVYDAIMKNPDRMEEELRSLLEPNREEVREEEQAENADAMVEERDAEERETLTSSKSLASQSTRTHEKKRKHDVTVVDYPTLGMVEVFSKIQPKNSSSSAPLPPKPPQKADVAVNDAKTESAENAAPQSLSRNMSLKSTSSKGVPKVIKADSMDDTRISGMPSTESSYYESASIKSQTSRKSLKSALSKRTKNSKKSKSTSKSASKNIPAATETLKSNASKTKTLDDKEKALLHGSKTEEEAQPESEPTPDVLKDSKTEEDAKSSTKLAVVTSASRSEKETGNSKVSTKSTAMASASGSEKITGNSKVSTKSTAVSSASQNRNETEQRTLENEETAVSITSAKSKKSHVSKIVAKARSNESKVSTSAPSEPISTVEPPALEQRPSTSEQVATPVISDSKKHSASEISKILSDLISTAATIESKNEASLCSRKSIASNYSEQPPELTLPPRLAKELKTDEENVIETIEEKVDKSTETKPDNENILESSSATSEREAIPTVLEQEDEKVRGDDKSVKSKGEQEITSGETAAEVVIEPQKSLKEEQPIAVHEEITAATSNSSQCDRLNLTEKQENTEQPAHSNTGISFGKDVRATDAKVPPTSTITPSIATEEVSNLDDKNDIVKLDDSSPTKRKKKWSVANVIRSIAAVSPRAAKKSIFDTFFAEGENHNQIEGESRDLQNQVNEDKESEQPSKRSEAVKVPATSDPASPNGENGHQVNAESSHISSFNISKFRPWNNLKKSTDLVAAKGNEKDVLINNNNNDEISSVCTEGAVVPSTLSPEKEAKEIHEAASSGKDESDEISGLKKPRARKFWKRKNSFDGKNGTTLDKVVEENECDLQTISPTSALLSSKEYDLSKCKQKDVSIEPLENLENQDDACTTKHEQDIEKGIKKSKKKFFWDSKSKTSKKLSNLTKVTEENEATNKSVVVGDGDDKLLDNTTTAIDIPGSTVTSTDKENETDTGAILPCAEQAEEDEYAKEKASKKKARRWVKVKETLLANTQVEENHYVDVAEDTLEKQGEQKMTVDKHSRKSLWITRKIMLPVSEKKAIDRSKELKDPRIEETTDKTISASADIVKSTGPPETPRSLTVVNYKNLEEIEVLSKDILENRTATTTSKNEQPSKKNYEGAAHSVLIEKKNRRPLKYLLSRKRMQVPDPEAVDVTETPADDSVSNGCSLKNHDEGISITKSVVPAKLETSHEIQDKECSTALEEEAATEEVPSSAAKSNAGESLWDELLSYITPKATVNMKSGFVFDFFTPKANHPVEDNNGDDEEKSIPDEPEAQSKKTMNTQTDPLVHSSYSEDGKTTLSPRAQLCIDEVNMNCGKITVNSKEVLHDRHTVDVDVCGYFYETQNENPSLVPSQDKSFRGDESLISDTTNETPNKPQTFRALTVAVSHPKSESSCGFDEIKDGHHTMVRAVSDEQVVAISASFAKAIESPRRLNIEEVEKMVNNIHDTKRKKLFTGYKKYAQKAGSSQVRTSTKAASIQPPSRKLQSHKKKQYNIDEDISMGFDSVGDSDSIDSPTKSWGGWFW